MIINFIIILLGQFFKRFYDKSIENTRPFYMVRYTFLKSKKNLQEISCRLRFGEGITYKYLMQPYFSWCNNS